MGAYPKEPIGRLVVKDAENGSQLAQALLRIALRFTGNVHDAEDVRQEFYLKLLSGKGESYRYEIDEVLGVHDRRVTSWVYQVLANTARDYLRKTTRRIRIENPLIEFEDGKTSVEDFMPADIRCNPLEVALERDATQAQQQLLRIFNSILKEGDYQELHLRYHGNSYEGIAALCAEPIGTVKSRIHSQRSRFYAEMTRVVPHSLKQEAGYANRLIT